MRPQNPHSQNFIISFPPTDFSSEKNMCADESDKKTSHFVSVREVDYRHVLVEFQSLDDDYTLKKRKMVDD